MSQSQHTEYDNCELDASHLGLKGKAWARHAWDDWYYCMVDGVWANGNTTKGILCREKAPVIARYLVRGINGQPLKVQQD
jgi:hypothetical protein